MANKKLKLLYLARYLREQTDEQHPKTMQDMTGYLAGCGINEISGGERQMALIARAMAQQAKILIMDEPTANLDYGNQYRVLETVRRLTEEGYTVLMSTHNPEHARRFAADVLALKDGTVYADGPSEETITPTLIEALYQIPAAVWEKDGRKEP